MKWIQEVTACSKIWSAKLHFEEIFTEFEYFDDSGSFIHEWPMHIHLFYNLFFHPNLFYCLVIYLFIFVFQTLVHCRIVGLFKYINKPYRQ